MGLIARKSRNTAGPLALVLAALVTPFSAYAQSPAPVMAQYMACARALGVAIHPQFAVLPAERGNGHGLYVYTDTSATFVPLGDPDHRDGYAQEYFVRAMVADLGEVFLNYREGLSGGKASNFQPGISYQLEIPWKDIALYRPRRAVMLLDARAREVLSRGLRERVITVKARMDDLHRYMTPQQASEAFEKDRATALAKLDQCRVASDYELMSVVNDEAQKLKDGIRTATVWEKEVNGQAFRRLTVPK